MCTRDSITVCTISQASIAIFPPKLGCISLLAESLKVGQYGGVSGGKSGQKFGGMHVPHQWSLGVSLALRCGNLAQAVGLELSSSM